MRTSLIGRTISFSLSAVLFVLAVMGMARVLPAQSKGTAKGDIRGSGPVTAACDREYLRGFMTQYLNALAHPAITYRVAAVDEEFSITWLRMNLCPRGSADKGPVNELEIHGDLTFILCPEL